MEAYCVFLMGNFIALPAFARRYGVYNALEDEWIIETSWQSALQMGGPIGAIIGVVIAGPLTSWIGYRWALISNLMLLNGFIFVFYFADSLPIMLASQLLEGIPWGVFIANSPAYCSEIVPIALRAPATQMLQMFWAIGAIIVQGVTYNYNNNPGEIAYRVPIALQWMFPTPLAILIFLAPESPWWLTRKGRYEEAAKAVGRLGTKDPKTNNENVSMMRRTIELEANEKEPSLLELWQGVNLYRTLIVCGVYAAQNLTGNLIANQAVYFFKQAGINNTLAFALGLITSALQTVMVMTSWVLTTYIGRRPIYVWGSLINTILLIALGVAASVGKSDAASLAQASLGLIVSVLFTLGPAPVSYAIIGETSSIRLRPLTTGIGRGAYYLVNIPCIFLASWMLNPDVSPTPLSFPQPKSPTQLTQYMCNRAPTSAANAATSGAARDSAASSSRGSSSPNTRAARTARSTFCSSARSTPGSGRRRSSILRRIISSASADGIRRGVYICVESGKVYTLLGL
jgi:SP family general alpha glucoside:H+ symporter-like MFS transporter